MAYSGRYSLISTFDIQSVFRFSLLTCLSVLLSAPAQHQFIYLDLFFCWWDPEKASIQITEAPSRNVQGRQSFRLPSNPLCYALVCPSPPLGTSSTPLTTCTAFSDLLMCTGGKSGWSKLTDLSNWLRRAKTHSYRRPMNLSGWSHPHTPFFPVFSPIFRGLCAGNAAPPSPFVLLLRPQGCTAAPIHSNAELYF